MDQDNTGFASVLQIPPDIDKYGSAFFLQQCWCWGQDIKRAEGNLLLEYGFTRERPPAGVEGCTTYFLSLSHGKSLLLWNFGLFYLDTEIGGLFLRRTTFTPMFTSALSLPRNIRLVTDLPPIPPPSTIAEGQKACELLSTTFLWISGYEKWVQSTQDEGYRLRCLKDQSEPIIPSEGFATEWERLARLCLNFVVDHDKPQSELAVYS